MTLIHYGIATNVKVVINQGEPDEETVTWGDFIRSNMDGISGAEMETIGSVISKGAIYEGGGWFGDTWTIRLKKDAYARYRRSIEA